MKAQYFQAIEQTFLECTGRGLAISEADRTYIEHWFESGIPVQVVQHAVMESCGDRDQKVRTIGIARKAVAHKFTVWQQRRLGRAPAAGAPKLESERTIFSELSRLLGSTQHVALQRVIPRVLTKLGEVERSGESKTAIHEQMLLVEAQMYDWIWLELNSDERQLIEDKLTELAREERFLTQAIANDFRARHRQKLLRDRLSLVSFDQIEQEAWR